MFYEEEEEMKSNLHIVIERKISIDGLPAPRLPVLIQGGIGFHDGKVWRTKMEPGDPIIQWEVKWWGELPCEEEEKCYKETEKTT